MKILHKSKRNRVCGLTLIEMIIVTAIIAIFSVFLAQFVAVSNKAMAVQQAAVPARAEAKQTMETMIKDLREGDPSGPDGVTISGTAPTQSIIFNIPDEVSSSGGIQSWREIEFSLDPDTNEVSRAEDGTATVVGRNVQSLTFSSSNNVITANLQTETTIAGGSDTVTATLTSQARLRN